VYDDVEKKPPEMFPEMWHCFTYWTYDWYISTISSLIRISNSSSLLFTTRGTNSFHIPSYSVSTNFLRNTCRTSNNRVGWFRRSECTDSRDRLTLLSLPEIWDILLPRYYDQRSTGSPKFSSNLYQNKPIYQNQTTLSLFRNTKRLCCDW